MQEPENPIGPTAELEERREMPHCAVDVPATLVVLARRTMVVGRMTELSLSGCRVFLPRALPHAVNAAVECIFRIRGVGFRLGGVVESVEYFRARVRFNTTSARCRDNLMEVLCEVELENKAKLLALTDSEARVPAPQPPVAQGQPGTQPDRGRDRRAAHRCGVGTSAVIDLVKVGSKLAGQIVDLSVGGCRIRTVERFPVGIYTRIEAEFQLHGLPFRLGGVIQAIHDRNTVGIRFLDMSQRKKDQVTELVAEIEESQA